MGKGARPAGDDPRAPAGLSPVPHHIGHRERARERFLKVGEEGLDDYELLELVLFLAIPRVDTKGLAKELLVRFGSYSAVLGASPDRLAEVKGMSSATATNLKIVQAAAQRFARHKVDRDLPILSSWAALLDYCRMAMAYEEVEQFRVLYLDKKNRLIADEVHQSGTVDHTPVYPREVIKRALELSATALILVHNHPSGDPSPSAADVQMTRQINDIARPLGITLHDHVIVGKTSHASLKGLKLL